MEDKEPFLEFTQIVDLVSENENECDSERCSNDHEEHLSITGNQQQSVTVSSLY